MVKDDRANIKVSQEALKKFQNLKKPGESYNQLADRLFCKDNPKSNKCKRSNR